MATNKRDESSRASRTRRQSNNSKSRVLSGKTIAGGNPLARGAAVASAVAAGVFLWSRRHEIRDQVDNLSEQISEWRERSQPHGRSVDEVAPTSDFVSSSEALTSTPGRSQVEIAQEALTLKELGTTA